VGHVITSWKSSFDWDICEMVFFRFFYFCLAFKLFLLTWWCVFVDFNSSRWPRNEINIIVFLFVCMFVSLFVCLFVRLYVCLYVCLFVRLFVFCLFVYSYVRLYVCFLFVCMFVCFLFVCMKWSVVRRVLDEWFFFFFFAKMEVINFWSIVVCNS
jgi:hypothetical protein